MPGPNVGTRVRPVSDWNLLDPDIIEWRAFGPQRDDQRRELSELRWTIEPLAARLAAGHGREDIQQRLADMVEIMGHAVAQGDTLTFSRADAEFHALLLQVTGNRMLEHLSGIVSSALQVSGGPVTGCDRPTETSVGLHPADRRGAGGRRRRGRPRRPCGSSSPSTRRWTTSFPRRASTDGGGRPAAPHAGSRRALPTQPRPWPRAPPTASDRDRRGPIPAAGPDPGPGGGRLRRRRRGGVLDVGICAGSTDVRLV